MCLYLYLPSLALSSLLTGLFRLLYLYVSAHNSIAFPLLLLKCPDRPLAMPYQFTKNSDTSKSIAGEVGGCCKRCESI